MESRVAEVRASAKDDLEEETRNEIMALRKSHIEEMGEMRKKDEQYFEVCSDFNNLQDYTFTIHITRAVHRIPGPLYKC